LCSPPSPSLDTRASDPRRTIFVAQIEYPREPPNQGFDSSLKDLKPDCKKFLNRLRSANWNTVGIRICFVDCCARLSEPGYRACWFSLPERSIRKPHAACLSRRDDFAHTAYGTGDSVSRETRFSVVNRSSPDSSAGLGGEAQSFHDGVVNRRADLGNLHVFAGGVHAVGQ